MSGWDEWEQSTAETDSPRLQLAPPLPDQREDPATNTATQQLPRPPAGRKARRAHRRAIAAQRQAESRTEQRRALDALTRASGLPVAIAAVLVLAVLIVVNVTGTDRKDTARSGPGTATGSADASAARTGDTPPTTGAGAGAMTLDPHAGTQVLPPQALPPAPNTADVDATMPLQVAEAFARAACATTSTETATQYATRLTSFATDQAAAAWPRGSATKIRCLQFTTAPDPDRPTSTTLVPVVVSAVQVYDAGGNADLVAYRWRATPTLTAQSDGTWAVRG